MLFTGAEVGDRADYRPADQYNQVGRTNGQGPQQGSRTRLPAVELCRHDPDKIGAVDGGEDDGGVA